MKKIALTLGAAVVALTSIPATSAQAGAVRFHNGWRAPVVVAPHVAPRVVVGAPAANCFWTRKKVRTPNGWYWKRVRVCGAVRRY
ncbi:hypothetical protein BMS3Bbin10_00273 [bacterium BMS3Bbin10]|nr:hypothetical protein BMS3Bbin10_00273 [bacterium BMS3Bbin10]